MFSSTSHLISSSLARYLLVWFIHPCSVQLWCLGMQHPLHPGGTFGQKTSISRLRKTWGKWSKGQGKWTSFSDGCQTSLWLHGNGGMPHCSMWSHILTSGLPPVPFLPLAPVFRARSSKISHLCRSALFHTRSAQRAPLLLYTVWSCDWKNLNTWVFPRWESAVIYIFA